MTDEPCMVVPDMDQAPPGAVAEHRLICGLLDDLAEASEVPQVKGVLDELAGVLREHFRDEEAPGGLFEELVMQRPENDSRLRGLAAAHEEIIKSVRALQELVDETARRLANIRETKAALVVKVRAHERAEGRLMTDTYLQDFGDAD